jgi:putative membrane protein
VFDPTAFIAGAIAFILAFLAAGGFALVFTALYRLVTPHNEGKLIREGNVAAAVALGGAVLGYMIPLASALSQTHSLVEFAAWATLAGVIQILVFWVVRKVALPDVSARIERGEVASAIYLLLISVAVGIINAACMTS